MKKALEIVLVGGVFGGGVLLFVGAEVVVWFQWVISQLTAALPH